MSPLRRSPLTLEHALLGFFMQKPVYGYELHQQLRQAKGIGLVWRLKQSHLYALLDRLEQEGWLQARLESQECRPARKLFSITPTGKAAFLSWVSAPVSSAREIRLEFQAKLFFACYLSKDVFDILLRNQVAACEAWRKSLIGQLEAIPSDDQFERMVFSYRIQQVDAILVWLTECNNYFQHTEQLSRSISERQL